jgi:hypothetical protein
MNDLTLTSRIVAATDWAAIVFLIAFALVALAKTAFENRFSDFLRLAVSDKYIKVYRDSGHITSGFTMVLFVVQLISFSFFILLALAHFGYAAKDDWLLYIRIIALLGVFVLAKFLIDKIIAASFNIEEFAEQFNLTKVSYRTYVALGLLPVNVILYFNTAASGFVFFAIIASVLVINLLTYLFSLRNYQNFIAGKLFYFILYLCALEIAPYYFMYYWFTRY